MLPHPFPEFSRPFGTPGHNAQRPRHRLRSRYRCQYRGSYAPRHPIQRLYRSDHFVSNTRSRASAARTGAACAAGDRTGKLLAQDPRRKRGQGQAEFQHIGRESEQRSILPLDATAHEKLKSSRLRATENRSRSPTAGKHSGIPRARMRPPSS